MFCAHPHSECTSIQLVRICQWGLEFNALLSEIIPESNCSFLLQSSMAAASPCASQKLKVCQDCWTPKPLRWYHPTNFLQCVWSQLRVAAEIGAQQTMFTTELLNFWTFELLNLSQIKLNKGVQRIILTGHYIVATCYAIIQYEHISHYICRHWQNTYTSVFNQESSSSSLSFPKSRTYAGRNCTWKTSWIRMNK